MRCPIQESPTDFLIAAVIPRAINVIRNSCRPLDNYLLCFVTQTEFLATNGHKYFNTNTISMAI